MHLDLGPFVIVQAGPPEARLIQFESEWPHQVQYAAGVRGQPYHISRVGRYFRLVKYDVKHGPAKSMDKEMTNRVIDERLALEFCGMQLASPIVLLSGCVGFGEEYTRVDGFSNRDVGAICLKGTTENARLGNPPHRIAETPMGMLNAIGLQNPGAERVVNSILPTLDFDETRYIANISGSTLEEYVAVARQFDDSPIDAMEINISCPNVKEGGVQFGNDPDMSARVVAAVRQVTNKPLITKLSPNQTDIQENARRCIEAGTDGLAVINTVMGMAVDVERRAAVIGNTQGGLSGPAIKPIALLKVWQVYQVAKPHGIPIIGQGGIASAHDALEFLIAGASTVGIGTALFYDPLICPKINQGIVDYLERHSLSHVGELTGTLRTLAR